MDKAKAKELYEASLAAGYSPVEAKERTFHFLKTGEIQEDPTESIWGATIRQESGGDQKAVSKKGATGVAQVMPSTGPEAAKLAGREWDPVAFKEDKGYNEAIGRAYMRKQFRDFGSPKLALAAYNAGPERVRKVLAGEATLPAETRNYVKTISGNSKMANDPKQEAKAIYDRMSASGASADEIRTEISKVLGKPPKATPAPVASPAPEQPAGPQEASVGDKIHEYFQDDVKRKMDNGFGLAAGSNSTVVGTIQGIRKLYNQAIGDDATVDRINEQNQQDRNYWEKKDPSGSGLSTSDLGKLLGNLGQFSLGPGGLMGGAATGAVQGILAPTTENDSQLGNAALGGALGAALPALGIGARKLIGTANPESKAAADALRGAGIDVPGGANYDSPLARMLAKSTGDYGQDLSPALTKEVARLAGTKELSNDVLENQLRQTGSQLGGLYDGLSAQPNNDFKSKLYASGMDYLSNGLNAKPNDEVMQSIEDLLKRSQYPIAGDTAQALRSQLGSLSIKGGAQEKTIYRGLKSALDELLEPEIQAAGRGGKKEELNAQYRILKLLRSGKGIPADGITPGALSNKIETAANKGAVDDKLREFLQNAAMVAPKARLGAEVGSEGVDRLVDRPQGMWQALMRAGTVPANMVMKTGLLQDLINNGAVGGATKEVTRNALLPILLRLNSGE